MPVGFTPQDHYFKQAKKDGFVARSAYKLEEIDQKFTIFGPDVRTVIDIGCAPGSRLQYASQKVSKYQSKKITEQGNIKAMQQTPKIIGFDLKKVTESYACVATYKQDVTEQEKVREILMSELGDLKVDCIISDMAPDTLGDSSTDAMRSINLIYDTMWMYHQLLKPNGKFAIKIFMGPGFEQFVNYCRQHRGTKNIKVFKPKSCRSTSKETYVVKI